jgi:hypothetical protein
MVTTYETAKIDCAIEEAAGTYCAIGERFSQQADKLNGLLGIAVEYLFCDGETSEGCRRTTKR